jgi:DNA anti-recombination protein RmuC
MTTRERAETGGTQETKRSGETFEQFEAQMAAWGREFEARMASWGEEFGPQMEAWAGKLAQRMERAGQRVGRCFDEQAASQAEGTEDLREGRLAVLRMVEEGKITAAEAESLLRALGE